METRVTLSEEHLGKSTLNRIQDNHPDEDKKGEEKNSDKALAVIVQL